MATRSSVVGPKRLVGPAYCPHCFLLVEERAEGAWPLRAARCPHCRLTIGPGRGRATPASKPGARGAASAVFAHQARQSEERGAVSPEAVCEAIRSVAGRLGFRPERLPMIDYQQRASEDVGLPALGDVYAGFGSWKRARRAAGSG